jgi:hypothetical protein
MSGALLAKNVGRAPETVTLDGRAYLRSLTEPYGIASVHFTDPQQSCFCWIGGQGTVPKEQNTQQCPGIGRRTVPQPLQS